jgi:hypothetical protein
VADIHKMKCRETLSRSHNLNTTDSNMGLTQSFSAASELHNTHRSLKNWEVFEIFSILKNVYYYLTKIGQNCV